MATITDASWPAIQALRQRIDEQVGKAVTVADACQLFTQSIAAAFETVALARVFLVLRASALPRSERAAADEFARTIQKTVSADTPVLTLAGTAGVAADWNDRTRSNGHRAIPLIDRELVQGAPMIAELLASLNVSFEALSSQAPAEIRELTGGINARFYVPDAKTTVDAVGRHVIASRQFVNDYRITTVFGMGGRYVSGELAVAIVFTTESLGPRTVDLFPAFISSFKIATSSLAERGSWFS